MEAEKPGELPLWDIRMAKTAQQWIYRKLTHTDWYLNGASRHHPAQKRMALSTFVQGPESATKAKSSGEGIQAECWSWMGERGKVKPDATQTSLPWCSVWSDWAVGVPAGIKVVFHPPVKIQTLMHSVKDFLGLWRPDILRVWPQLHWANGMHHVDQCRGHQQYIHLNYQGKSALAEHCTDTGLKLFVFSPTVLFDMTGFWDRLILEPMEIQLACQLACCKF